MSVNVDQCEEIKIKQKADAIRERRFRGYGSSLIFILEMCYVLFSYARLIIDVENEINVRTMIYLNYFVNVKPLAQPDQRIYEIL